MPLILKQNAIDVYVAENDPLIIISEEDGHFNEKDGGLSEARIGISVAYIDVLIEALQQAKEIILTRETKKN